MAETFGNYQIIRRIAAGGMAEVFLAKQTGLGGFERLVCIKRILPHLGEQEDFITMFQDEARIAANLTNPHIAQIYDIGEADGSYYIAMEYVRGEDLRRIYNAEVARGRAMPLEPAAQIMMGAALGLDFAHRQTTIDGRPLGLVHRDVSPQNIIVTYDGHPKIVDFGVAKAAVKMNQTRSGVLKGKYSYMSPEQASGDPIDARTDIFALGITVYEVTTGTRLFKRENELETLHSVIECKVTPPGQVLPGYDSDLEAILMRCLSYDPDDRYPTAGDLARDLEGWLVANSFATSASSLGIYMQDLFAEKLADELLFGGSPWEEEDTGQRATSKESKPSTGARTQPSNPSRGNSEPQGQEPTEIADTTDVTVIEEESKIGVEEDHWRDHSHGGQWQGESTESEVRTSTHGLTAPKPAQNIPSVNVSGVVAHPPRPKRGPGIGTLAGIIALLAAIGGAAWFYAGQPSSQFAMSGALVIDSEPRGARVEFVGHDVDSLNRKYGGYRTPFTIEEGLRVDIPLRARFIKDGMPIAVHNLPELQEGKVPRPMYVELKAAPDAKKPQGLLNLITVPEGATVKIDGQPIDGTTPLNDVPVTGGKMHRIEFALPGHENRTETRFVEPGGKVFIEKLLYPSKKAPPTPTPGATPPSPTVTQPSPTPRPAAKGYITVTASLPLQVSVNGRSVGTTPVEAHAVSAGSHRVKLHSSDEGFTLHRKVRVRSGKTESISAEPGKGKLSLNATPWAWVKLGSKAAQETPVTLNVYEGEYAVTFECPDGSRKQEAVRVTAGQTARSTTNCR